MRTPSQRKRGSWWHRLTLWQKVIAVFVGGCLVLLVAVYLLTVWIYPGSVSSTGNSFVLVGIVAVAILSIAGSVGIPIGFQLVGEYITDRRSSKALQIETELSQLELKPRLAGIPSLIHRPETDQIFQHLSSGKPVLLIGDAGIGKSGITVSIIELSQKNKATVLLLDARRLARVTTITDLQSHLGLEEPLNEVVERLGQRKNLIYVAIDQIDDIVGTAACQVLVDFALACLRLECVRVLVVSRYWEANESGALRPLFDAGFEQIRCRPLSTNTIESILATVGIANPSNELLQLGSNILNLELICEIAHRHPGDNLTQLLDEIDLWDKYLDTLKDREDRAAYGQGREMIIEATQLARAGLKSIDRSFVLNDPLTRIQTRLVSNQLIAKLGRLSVRYRFSHEKIQDYLYARDAALHELSVAEVNDQIDYFHAGNVLLWMRDLYRRHNPPMYAVFLEELISG